MPLRNNFIILMSLLLSSCDRSADFIDCAKSIENKIDGVIFSVTEFSAATSPNFNCSVMVVFSKETLPKYQDSLYKSDYPNLFKPIKISAKGKLYAKKGDAGLRRIFRVYQIDYIDSNYKNFGYEKERELAFGDVIL